MPAIGRHSTATDDGAWDGPGNVARLKSDGSAAYYRRMYGWADPDGDPETKSAYKFPNHFVGADGNIGAASTRACSAGIAVLNGGRGGSSIPSSDRQGVYNHLAGHLRDAEMEPPELKGRMAGSLGFKPQGSRHGDRPQRGDLIMANEEIERRYVPSEFRVDADGAIEGYAAVFDVWSEPLGWFKEKIRKGAFTETLKTADVRALFNHDPNFVIGRNKAETLELAEDGHGLHFRARPPDTQWANDLTASMKRGDINQGSFGFYAIRDEWDNKNDTRELIEVELFDVSVVTFPAYPQTNISARSLVNQFIIRVRSGDADPELIGELIEQLETVIAAEDGRDPEPVEDQWQVRLAHLKRRIDLMEIV